MIALSNTRAAVAQLAVSADVALNSQFVWRGVTSTNRPVIQSC